MMNVLSMEPVPSDKVVVHSFPVIIVCFHFCTMSTALTYAVSFVMFLLPYKVLENELEVSQIHI